MEPQLAQVLVLAFAGASLLAAFEMKLALEPPSCPECAHCRMLQHEKRQRQEELRDAYARRYGLSDRDDDETRRHRRS